MKRIPLLLPLALATLALGAIRQSSDRRPCPIDRTRR